MIIKQTDIVLVRVCGVSQWRNVMNNNFDEITCRRLRVVDEQGKPAITLQSIEGNNYVLVYDKQGEKAINLSSIVEGGNRVTVYDEQGETVITLSSIKGSNSVTVYDKQGEPAITLQSIEGRNWVAVRDNLTGKSNRLD